MSKQCCGLPLLPAFTFKYKQYLYIRAIIGELSSLFFSKNVKRIKKNAESKQQNTSKKDVIRKVLM